MYRLLLAFPNSKQQVLQCETHNCGVLETHQAVASNVGASLERKLARAQYQSILCLQCAECVGASFQLHFVIGMRACFAVVYTAHTITMRGAPVRDIEHNSCKQ